MVWGSDWGHIMLNWKIPMPNDGDIADLLAAWVPDAATRKKILVDNPAKLYDFNLVVGCNKRSALHRMLLWRRRLACDSAIHPRAMPVGNCALRD